MNTQQNEAAWDAAATEAAIKTQGEIIGELKQQLTDLQDAHHTLQQKYDALFDAAGEVTSAWTWNEPAPGDKIAALSTLLNKQANEEDDQC